MKQDTQSQCSGTAYRDGVGREVGGVFRMGGHMWLIRVDVWQNPQRCCNYPPIKINKLIFEKRSTFKTIRYLKQLNSHIEDVLVNVVDNDNNF